jgi:hypothetical protein
MNYHSTDPVALILGVQRPRTTKFCTSVMGSATAALPTQKYHRSVMHKVSLFFSRRSSESDIYHIERIADHKLLQNIHKMSFIHLILDNFEAALCMFIRGSGASRVSISDDTCSETTSALTSILKFVRGSQVYNSPDSNGHNDDRDSADYSTFQGMQEQRSNQILCAKLGIVDRLFCIMSVPSLMEGKYSDICPLCLLLF